MKHLIALTAVIFGITVYASPIKPALNHDSTVPANNNCTNSTTIPSSSVQPFPFQYNEENIDSLASILDWIERIPDEVIAAGPETLLGWSKDHDYVHWRGYRPSEATDEDADHDLLHEHDDHSTGSDLTERQNWGQIASCAFEIGKAVAEGYIPVAKLRRVKKLIEEAGGVWKAAKALLKADKMEDLKEFGEAFWELSQVLLGVDGVVDACFNMF
ncbi:hypothetical protein ACN47E_006089 [Coniothyrium glycines]